MALSFACSAVGAFAGACNNAPENPPMYTDTYDAGTGGNTGGGGGGGGNNTECAVHHGQCLLAGDMCDGASCSSCPTMLSGDNICGPNTLTEAGVLVYICCTGFNDAGSPDARGD
jgi:hypothetical protein